MELGRVEIDDREEWNLAAIFALLVGVRCSTDDDYEQFDTHFRNGLWMFQEYITHNTYTYYYIRDILDICMHERVLYKLFAFAWLSTPVINHLL